MEVQSFPVFYDRSGKRLRRTVAAVCALMFIVVTLVACVAPGALSPTRPTTSGIGWAREFLAAAPTSQLPIIGEESGVLTRVVVVDDHRLLDPVTNQFLRDATDWEIQLIGDSPYAVEHFSTVPDHTLILTFDDGPDATYTPPLLDLLSREHVPATFFVLGEEVVKNPEILRRTVNEGHMVANHTMTHVDLDKESDFRDREEITATDHVIRGTANYDTRLFRMPHGDPDNNPLALLIGQQLGQVHVGYDIDTVDWSYPAGEEIPVPPLDGKGHVILLHDAGGDRTETIRMVEKLIRDAKAQGYTFTTLAPVLPEEYIPHKNVVSTIADLTILHVLRGVYVMPGKVLGFLFWFGTGSLAIMSTLYLTLAIVSEFRSRRRKWGTCPTDKLPLISVVLAAYNEEKVIARTLDTLRESDYPAACFEVVAVNDGSSDSTLELLRAYDWDKLIVVDQPNSGKSSAINNGINHADPASTVIVTMDADTLFRRQTILALARHFVGHRRVGAVAGHVKVGNRRNLITAWQSLEYISGICVTRMAEQTMHAIGIVPGACSAWRRSALEEIGGFNEDTLAEDADATLSLQKLGYTVLNENEAIADTEAPETMRTLARQRKRWTFGSIQVLWKYKGMFFRPRYGLLGCLALPYAAISLIFPLVFLPFTVIVAVLSLWAGDWKPIALFAALVTLVHMLIAIIGVAIAREKIWHLLVVLYYRPIYEVMRAYLLYASTYRAVKGTIVAWDKLERRNSVVPHH